MAGEVMIDHKRDITNHVTLEVLTQNGDCHSGLCHLAEVELKDQIIFLTPSPTKTLIGFKSKEAFRSSVSRIGEVLSNFSNQFQASVFNA